MIFVVQKHYAKNLHYDFRLEIDGILKSWAVPKEPSLIVGEKRLAILTEDHPLSYANFEGVIPKGQYGAGKVEIWDKGDFENGKIEPLHLCFKKGEICIILYGNRLRGSYTLLRLKDKHWLLFKQREYG